MAKMSLFEAAAKAQSNVLKERGEIRKHTAKLEKAQHERDYYNRLIARNSYFHEGLLGQTLAELISTISEEKFVYIDEIDYETSVNAPKLSKPKVIIQEWIYDWVRHSDDFQCSDLEQKLRKDYAVRMNTHFGNVSLSPVFCVQGDHISLNDNYIKINLDKFGYVKDFLEFLVTYCCENQTSNSIIENVNTSLVEFLKKYKEKHTTKNPIKILKRNAQVGE